MEDPSPSSLAADGGAEPVAASVGSTAPMLKDLEEDGGGAVVPPKAKRALSEEFGHGFGPLAGPAFPQSPQRPPAAPAVPHEEGEDGGGEKKKKKKKKKDKEGEKDTSGRGASRSNPPVAPPSLVSLKAPGKPNRAVLVPPLNFGMVLAGIYRSGYPNSKNFPFLKVS